MVVILAIMLVVALLIMRLSTQENFAPANAVTAWKYPEEAVRLSEENVNFLGYNPEGVTPFFGHQNPIGDEIWYARSPMDAIESVPLSTTISSPACCPSEYSTSTGCLCYGNASRILNNIHMHQVNTS